MQAVFSPNVFTKTMEPEDNSQINCTMTRRTLCTRKLVFGTIKNIKQLRDTVHRTPYMTWCLSLPCHARTPIQYWRLTMRITFLRILLPHNVTNSFRGKRSMTSLYNGYHSSYFLADGVFVKRDWKGKGQFYILSRRMLAWLSWRDKWLPFGETPASPAGDVYLKLW